MLTQSKFRVELFRSADIGVLNKEFQEKADSRLNRSRSGGNIANPLYSKSKARPASLIIPKESLASAFEEEEEDPKGPRRSKSTIIKEPSSPLIKRPFSRSRSGTTVSASDSISSGEPSPGSGLLCRMLLFSSKFCV